jgi:gas vesicle protein
MRIVSGLLAGALAGIVTGVLIAPEKGVKTQKKLSKRSNKLLRTLEKSGNSGFDNLLKNVNKTTSRRKKKKSGFSLKYFS